jgi:hypothetical protein
MDVLAIVIVLAIFIEKVIERVKEGISPAKPAGWVWFVAGSAIGVLCCLLFGANAFAAFGIGANTDAAFIAGCVITGIAAGGGSNFVHDIFDSINKTKQG